MPNRDIASQAEYWFTQVEDEALSSEEWDLFETWLCERAEHMEAYEALQRTWKRSAELCAPSSLELPTRTPGKSMVMPLSHRQVVFGWAAVIVGLSVLLAAVVGLATWDGAQPRLQVIRTDVGGLEHLSLADGTQIDLNTATEVKVALRSGRRDIELVRGEVLFDVAHDGHRPFVVSVTGKTARAFGTRFSVRLRGNRDVEVLVINGEVGIDCDRDSKAERSQRGSGCELQIGAGDNATFRSGAWTLTKLQSSQLERRLAWRHGFIWFGGESLTEVAAEFNRYNHRRIEIADPSLAMLRLGGIFQPRDLDGFVETLQRFASVKDVSSDPKVIRLVGPPDVAR